MTIAEHDSYCRSEIKLRLQGPQEITQLRVSWSLATFPSLLLVSSKNILSGENKVFLCVCALLPVFPLRASFPYLLFSPQAQDSSVLSIRILRLSDMIHSF